MRTYHDFLKETLGVECSIYKDNENVSTTLMQGGKRATGMKTDNPALTEMVLKQGKILQSEEKILGKRYYSAYLPLRNIDGVVTGMLFIGKDRTAIEKTQREMYFAVSLLVFCDEVRNLAMRAAESAKSTAVLIDGTVKKVKEGSGLMSTTIEVFGKVAESTDAVAGLLNEIAAASKDQSQGVGQINSAVADIDRVTQQNAATAEESAAAAAELASHASQMKRMADELLDLVGGQLGTDARQERREPRPRQAEQPGSSKLPALPAPAKRKR